MAAVVLLLFTSMLWILGSSQRNSNTGPSQSNAGGSISVIMLRCGDLVAEDALCQDLPGRNSNHAYPFDYRLQTGLVFTSEGNFFVLDNIGANQPLPCVQSVRYFSCLLTAPPCDVASDLPLRICPESCLAFNTLMESSTCNEFQDLIELVEIASFMYMLDVYLPFNCSDTSTYSFSGENGFDNDSCTTIFSPQVQDDILAGVYNVSATTVTTIVPPTTQAPFPAVAVGVSVGVALFVLVVVGVVVIVLAVKCRRGGRVVEGKMEGKKGRQRRTHKMRPITDARVSSNGRVHNSKVDLEESYVNRIPDDSPHYNRASPTEMQHYARASPTPDTAPLEHKERENYKQLFGSKVVAYEDLRVGESIGEGAFGKVLEGYYIKAEVEYKVAIKTLKTFSSPDAQKEFFSECLLMKNFDHPNVLGLVGVCFDSPDDIPYLLLPFMENGNIKDFLKKRRHHVTDFETLPQGMTEQQLFEMCADVCRGMEYLATNRFVHRDLAARNCMLSSNLDVCVSDFGLARDVYSSDYYRASKGARLPVKWMPPETLHDTVSNEKTDVWAYGVTCWEVYSLGRTPYPGVPNYDILKFIARGERLSKPALCPQQLFDLLSSCWHEDAEERPTFTQLSQAIDTIQQSL